jgi:hypothetical protein
MVCQWQDGGDRIPRAEVTLEGGLPCTGPRVGRAGGVAADLGCGLRCALDAPHKARRRDSFLPQSEIEHSKNKQMQNHKEGTFLTR